MKIQELRAELDRIASEHGNIEVVIEVGELSDVYAVNTITVRDANIEKYGISFPWLHSKRIPNGRVVHLDA